MQSHDTNVSLFYQIRKIFYKNKTKLESKDLADTLCEERNY